MRKVCVGAGVFVLVFSFCISFAQEGSPETLFLRQQEEYLRALQKESPKLYGFEKRLLDIQKEMQKIINAHQQGKLTKERLRELVIPLIKEEIEIRNNPDYQVEQRLNMFLGMGGQVPFVSQAPRIQ